MRQTKHALYWIVSILRKHKIQFEITGGLAAELYGSKRKLADIDIDIHEKDFKKMILETKSFVKFGPKFYKDKHWQLYLMTLKYKNQLIDICGIEHTKIFDHEAKKWISLKANLSKDKMKYFDGLRLPVESEKELINYKKELGRKVDRIDVAQLNSKH